MQLNKFNQSVDDIIEFFALLEYVDSIEVYKQITLPKLATHVPLVITSIHQKCMRSNAVLMLYNIVESTVVECILAIYDAIKDEHIKYVELIDPLRDMWLGNKMDNNDGRKTRIAKTKRIINDLQSDISFDDKIGRFDGNVDLRLILNVCKEFKIQLGSIPNKEEVAVSLKTIKDARNHLAHGDITYSSYGSSILLSDIIKLKDDTLKFLHYFIQVIDSYIRNKKYKAT